MYMGIDIGTSSIKVVLIDDEQQTIATVSEPLTLSRPFAGWSEQNPSDWWTASCRAIDTICATHQTPMRQLRAIGLSGQMHGACCLDKANEVIRPAILWNDGRASQECTELELACPTSRSIAGNIAMAGFTAPKLAWLKKHEPQNFERIAKVLLPKDYIRFCLSGDYCSEMSDASGTLWLDVAKRQWSDTLLAVTDLDTGHMPKLVEGTEVSGSLHSHLQKRWGIKQEVIIAGGAGDNAASACGMGVINPNQAFVSLGTSGVLFVSGESFLPNTDQAIHAFCHALPNSWHQMGVILSAADSLEWFAQSVNQSVPELDAKLPRTITPSDCLFLPYLNGERTPHNDANARGAFIGLSRRTRQEDLTQSVMEGVCFAFRDSQEALLASGSDFDSAIVVGGGAQSTTWLTILSSVINRPLKIPANSDLGAALGAARLAICAANKIDPASVCQDPKIKTIIEPATALVSNYQESFEQYRKLYSALKTINQ